jgi:hypothetical protein
VLSDLARVDYAGIDHLPAPSGPRCPWLRSGARRFFAGTALSILAIVLVGATSGVEDEVTNGPLRPVDAMIGALSGGASGPVTMILQGGGVTFMDDSAMDKAALDRLAGTAPFPVVPFGKYLFNIDGASALEISVPDGVYTSLTGQSAAEGCARATAIVDDTVGVPVGGRVSLNGVPVTVARVDHGIAQMNRSIAIVADSTVRSCVAAGTSTAYFGALAATGDTGAVQAALDAAGVGGAAVSEASFREHNRDFWRANATPLILQIILYLTLFSAFAAAGERQSALQRNSREIGMLHATGVDFASLRAIERRRALLTTFKAALVAAPVMVPVAAAFNASELGVRISVGPTELAVGTSLTLVAMLLASRRSLSQFRRSLDLPLAVKG